MQHSASCKEIGRTRAATATCGRRLQTKVFTQINATHVLVIQQCCRCALRQYAAIHLRVPNSGADWLDDMIAEAREMDAAERAMQGLIVGVERPAFDYIAKTAHDMAEEMTDAARSKGLAP